MGDACPFCLLLDGVETEHNRLDDVVWRDERTTAFVSPRWWPAAEGHVLVIPNEHVESLDEIDDDLLGSVYATVKRIAAALPAAYGCQGSSTRQHNGAGAGQDVWHLHVHVFPRSAGDDLYARDAEYRWAAPAERAPYAARLRAVLQGSGPGLTRA
jgi:histidine triad (HIT) family protein